jgi:hypothetical protein
MEGHGDAKVENANDGQMIRKPHIHRNNRLILRDVGAPIRGRGHMLDRV